MNLPNGRAMPGREFGGQRFVRHIAEGVEWKDGEFPGFESRDTGIFTATNGLAYARVLRAATGGILPANYAHKREFVFYFVLKGGAKLYSNTGGEQEFSVGDSVVVPTGVETELKAAKNSEILCVVI